MPTARVWCSTLLVRRRVPVSLDVGRARGVMRHGSMRTTQAATLPRPTVLYQSNHLLAVYKPPGWHSIPHAPIKSQDHDDELRPHKVEPWHADKCLVSYLRRQRLGGGSQGTFLNPLHRIDQPCSGVLLLGKTSKAASRIQSQWKQGRVQKVYYVVVHGHDLHNRPEHDDTQSLTWRTLQGDLMPHRRFGCRTESGALSKGWSVQMKPVTSPTQPSFGRRCALEYRVVSKRNEPRYGANDLRLLQIQTSEGARHMIRALLASHGWTVAGDVRYGPKHETKPLRDASVALHAYSLQLPDTLVLGETHSLERYFSAPIPDTWFHLFGWSQQHVEAWHVYSRSDQ